MSKISRIVTLFEAGGTREVFKGVRDSIFKDSSNNLSYANKRDNQARWDFIKPYVVNKNSLIDIGCAQGYFVRKAASHEIQSTGIDIDKDRIEEAKSSTKNNSFSTFEKNNLNPENIVNIPDVDVILFLTVHHHWEKSFGLDKSEEMFQVLLDRADLLIYEPPGNRPVIYEQKTLRPDNSMKFYTNRLKSLYGDSIEILDVELFGYENTDRKIQSRKDPIFIIDASKYRIHKQN